MKHNIKLQHMLTCVEKAAQAQLILISYLDVRGKDLSGSGRGFIVGARMTGASVTKTAQLAGVSIGRVTSYICIQIYGKDVRK